MKKLLPALLLLALFASCSKGKKPTASPVDEIVGTYHGQQVYIDSNYSFSVNNGSTSINMTAYENDTTQPTYNVTKISDNQFYINFITGYNSSIPVIHDTLAFNGYTYEVKISYPEFDRIISFSPINDSLSIIETFYTRTGIPQGEGMPLASG